MSFDYIKKTYGVPAERGRRVICSGKPGIIIGCDGHYIQVVLDGLQHSGNYHPTWEVVYGDMGPLPAVAKRWRCLPPWRSDWLIDSFEVMAPTRSKARYQAYLDLTDVGIEPRGMLYIKVRSA